MSSGGLLEHADLLRDIEELERGAPATEPKRRKRQTREAKPATEAQRKYVRKLRGLAGEKTGWRTIPRKRGAVNREVVRLRAKIRRENRQKATDRRNDRPRNPVLYRSQPPPTFLPRRTSALDGLEASMAARLGPDLAQKAGIE